MRPYPTRLSALSVALLLNLVVVGCEGGAACPEGTILDQFGDCVFASTETRLKRFSIDLDEASFRLDPEMPTEETTSRLEISVFHQTAIPVTAEPLDPNAEVRIIAGNQSFDMHAPRALISMDGVEELTIEVTAPSGKRAEYVIRVQRTFLDISDENPQVIEVEPLQPQFGVDIASPQYGHAIAATDEFLVVGTSIDHQKVAVYRLRDGNWVEYASLGAPASASSLENFGASVAIHGHTIVIGAPPSTAASLNTSGSVYVSEYDTQSEKWSAPQAIELHSVVLGDDFGTSVAIYDDEIYIGAPGAFRSSRSDVGTVYVCQRSENSWNDCEELAIEHALGNCGITILNLCLGDEPCPPPQCPTDERIGTSLDVERDVLVVGAALLDPNDSDPFSSNRTSAVLIFERDAEGNLTQTQRIPGSALGTTDRSFGWDVAIRDNWLAVSAPMLQSVAGTPETGAVYLFEGTRRDENSAHEWCTPENPGKIACPRVLTPDVSETGGRFGWALDLQREVFAVGAYKLQEVGQAFIYEQVNGTWSEDPSPTQVFSGDEKQDRFGWSIALSGNGLAIGATGMDHPQSNEPEHGAVWFIR